MLVLSFLACSYFLFLLERVLEYEIGHGVCLMCAWCFSSFSGVVFPFHTVQSMNACVAPSCMCVPHGVVTTVQPPGSPLGLTQLHGLGAQAQCVYYSAHGPTGHRLSVQLTGEGVCVCVCVCMLA
jgi:hypothetical protein